MAGSEIDEGIGALVFYGRCSTEDNQDPETSRGWQLGNARKFVEPLARPGDHKGLETSQPNLDVRPVLAQHPPAVYLREEPVRDAVNGWLGDLFAPEHLDQTVRALASRMAGRAVAPE